MSRAQVFLRILNLASDPGSSVSGGWLGLGLVLGLPWSGHSDRPERRAALSRRRRRPHDQLGRVPGRLLAYLAFLTMTFPAAAGARAVRSGPLGLADSRFRSPAIVKAIPSCLVLGLLSIVSSIVSLIAAISILLMERYPARLWKLPARRRRLAGPPACLSRLALSRTRRSHGRCRAHLSLRELHRKPTQVRMSFGSPAPVNDNRLVKEEE